jgi:hypothetical protein
MMLDSVRLITDVLTHTLKNVLLTVNVLKMILNVLRYIKVMILKIDYQTTVL